MFSANFGPLMWPCAPLYLQEGQSQHYNTSLPAECKKTHAFYLFSLWNKNVEKKAQSVSFAKGLFEGF
jgi:hypothetical protein